LMRFHHKVRTVFSLCFSQDCALRLDIDAT
jgi:hypothetical protein